MYHFVIFYHIFSVFASPQANGFFLLNAGLAEGSAMVKLSSSGDATMSFKVLPSWSVK